MIHLTASFSTGLNVRPIIINHFITAFNFSIFAYLLHRAYFQDLNFIEVKITRTLQRYKGSELLYPRLILPFNY